MLQLNSDSTCQRVSGEHPEERRRSSLFDEGDMNARFLPSNTAEELNINISKSMNDREETAA